MKINFPKINYIKQNQKIKQENFSSNKNLEKTSPCLMGLDAIGNYNIAFGHLQKTYFEEDETYDLENLLGDNTGFGETSNKVITNNIPVYSIDKYGRYIRFSSCGEASRELKISKDGVTGCLSGRQMTTGGYAFVRAENVEKMGEEDIEIDERLLTSFAKLLACEDNSLYAIDKNGNYQKFENINIASKTLGIRYNSVLSCFRGDYKKTNGYIFVPAGYIEKKDKDEQTVVDKEKVARLLSNFEKSDENAVYAIDKNGNCTKFLSRREAARELGLDRAAISKCIEETARTTKGYTFVKAEDIENIDENGEKSIDEEALKKVLFRFEDPEKMIYSIDKYGQYRLFKNQQEASVVLQMPKARVSACVTKKRKKSGEYTFIKARELEVKQPDGSYKVDVKRVQHLAKRLRGPEIYSVDKNGNYQKFASASKAAKALKIDESSIFKSLNGERGTVGRYKFTRAYMVEKQNEDGKTVVDDEKIINIMKYLQRRAVYIFKEDGSFERHDSKWHAARNHAGMYFDRNMGRFAPVNGYTYMEAKDFETIDDDKTIRLDEEGLKNKFEILRKQAVYIIDEEGNCQRFNNRKYASLFSGAFTYHPNTRTHTINDGFKCKKAIDVESKDENGLYHLDKNKIEIKKLYPSYPPVDIWNKK